jgi:predicted metalloendopeptidase
MKYKSRFEREISIPEFNNNIYPGDNFYLHVNDNWLKHTKIPSYTSSYSVNEEIEDIIKKDLYNLLDKVDFIMSTATTFRFIKNAEHCSEAPINLCGFHVTESVLFEIIILFSLS